MRRWRGEKKHTKLIRLVNVEEDVVFPVRVLFGSFGTFLFDELQDKLGQFHALHGDDVVQQRSPLVGICYSLGIRHGNIE